MKVFRAIDCNSDHLIECFFKKIVMIVIALIESNNFLKAYQKIKILFDPKEEENSRYRIIFQYLQA